MTTRNKNRVTIACFLYVTLLAACNKKGTIIDIPEVINKSHEDVGEVLGEPDTSYWQPILNKEVFTAEYTKYKIEFRYFNGVASDIIVRDPQDLAFDPTTLERFGVAKLPPDKTEKGTLLRWDNPHPNIKMISFFTKSQDAEGKPLVYEFYFKGRD